MIAVWSMMRGLAARLRSDRRAVSTMLFAVSATAILGVSGLAVDVGMGLAARNALQANTDSAALAAAQNWSAPGGTAATAVAAASAWHTTHTVPFVTITQASASAACVTATSSVPLCTSSLPNAIKFTQSGTVVVRFMRQYGFNLMTVSATSTAVRAGGLNKPMHILFVLDGTASMSTADSSGCSVPNVTSPLRWQCALYGVQLVMKQLIAAQDPVGISMFPGFAASYVPSTPCPSMPATVKYSSSAVYMIGSTAFSSTYVSNHALVDASPPVLAVGDNSNNFLGCLTNKGGQGSYYADAITKGQATLNANAVTGYQNVLILLSDGAATATSSQSSFSTTKECTAAVTAAAAATTAGTWVYSVAYGSPTTASSSGCNGDISPCAAMQQIASDPGKFFTTDTTCNLATSPNKYADLATVFNQIAYSLLTPRLVVSQ